MIGFSIAAPFGPIGILGIRRTLATGRLSGLFSGLGAESADAFYGSMSAGGLTVISTVLIGHQVWLRLISGVFFATYLSRPFLVELAWAAPRVVLPLLPGW